MSAIYVCRLATMTQHAETLRPSHLVSLVAPEDQPATPPAVAGERHLKVGVHDISEAMPGAILPQEEHVAALVDFVQHWPAAAPLLVHCLAGVSRSMAAALIALVVKAPGREREAASLMRASAPHAQPNRRMIELADRRLGSAGRLIAAREAMGPGAMTAAAPLVRLSLLR